MEQSLLYDEFARALIEIGAIKFGEFRLKLHETNPDAPLSPIYVDLRLLRSYPRERELAAMILQNVSEKLQFDLVADVPQAITPVVSIFAHLRGIPMITPRIGKTHGSGAKIEGVFRPGQRVLLVDDVITDANSKLEAARLLEGNRLVVEDIVVFLDREQGGKKNLLDAGYQFHASYKLLALLRQYRAWGLIDHEMFDRVQSYIVFNQA